MNDDEIAKMFYDQKVAAEKMVSDPTGEFAALNDNTVCQWRIRKEKNQ